MRARSGRGLPSRRETGDERRNEHRVPSSPPSPRPCNPARFAKRASSFLLFSPKTLFPKLPPESKTRLGSLRYHSRVVEFILLSSFVLCFSRDAVVSFSSLRSRSLESVRSSFSILRFALSRLIHWSLLSFFLFIFLFLSFSPSRTTEIVPRLRRFYRLEKMERWKRRGRTIGRCSIRR